MLREALRYPTRGDDAVESLLVGGGLHLLVAVFPVTIVVALPLLVGYLVRVIADSVGSETARTGAGGLPTFRRVGRLAREGLGGIVVGGAFLLLPSVLLAVTVNGVLSRGGTAGGDALVLLVGSFVTLFLALGLLYPLPAGVAAYAVTGRVRAAFDRGTLGGAAADLDYFVGVGTAVACLAAAAAALTALDRVVVGFFLAFYLEVVAAVAAATGVAGTVEATTVATERERNPADVAE